jgi:polysaccharide deacetylase family protein (PEP-CTERM system associated)
MRPPCALKSPGLSGLVSNRARSLSRALGDSDLSLSNTSSSSWYGDWKPVVEFVLALLGLIVAAPVIILAAVAIKLTSRGPAFYSQVRLGKNGRRFTIYKLRTMRHQAEAGTGPVWAAPGDSRICAVGKLLRATHLDELPQLINVLLGQMSLVGPRPERPEIVQQLQARLDNYLDRLTVRPGITGLAQVQLPPDVDLEGVRKKLVCDLHYIQHLSAGLDWRILICTGPLLLGIPLRWSRRWLGIPEPLKERANLQEQRVHRLAAFAHTAKRSTDEQETPAITNVLSIDVEDYFQVTNFEARVERREWDKYPSRVVANTRRLLNLLDRRQARATFFVLGWVGRRFPGLVREIVKAGHEIGCHSYWHRLVYRQKPNQFRQDLRLARDVLESASGQPVVAYRAPSYSITRESLWALDILEDEGFRFDSSIFPTYHPRYGIPEAPRHLHRLNTDHGSLWEFPPSAGRLGGLNVPAAGGGYFRLLPARLTALCFRQINRAGHPGVFVVHPWEIDPDQPRLAPPLSRDGWRHYLNLRSTEKKLDWFLRQFSFGALGDVARRYMTREDILPLSEFPPPYRLSLSEVG